MTDKITVLLVARDEQLIEAVEASALALGVSLVIARDSAESAQLWSAAVLRLVAVEMVGRIARLGEVSPTVLVGTDANELVSASAELGYPVILLPDGSKRLADVLAAAMSETESTALTLSLIGASGGLGTSTLAVSLALVAAHYKQRCVAVELAKNGSGLDLLVGQEFGAGVRWSDLLSARGELGPLDESLLSVERAWLLPLGRENPELPSAPAIRAVLSSLRRSLDLIVVDAGNEPLTEADVQVLLVGADVRCVAAARAMAQRTGLTPSAVVVRTGPGRRLSPSAVSAALGVPALGVLREDSNVARAAELAQPPLGLHTRRYRKDVERIWAGLHSG